MTKGVKVEVKEPKGEELMEAVEDREGARVKEVEGEREESIVRDNVETLDSVSTGDGLKVPKGVKVEVKDSKGEELIDEVVVALILGVQVGCATEPGGQREGLQQGKG